jgi:hypothetical protein
MSRRLVKSWQTNAFASSAPTSDCKATYPAKDWLADCDWYFSRSHEAKGMEMEELIEYFETTRKHLLLAEHCRLRFQAAIEFLEDNRKSLDFGKALVVGPESSLVSKHVIKTLHRFFAGRPDGAINFPIPIDVFIREVQTEIESQERKPD